MAIPLMPLIIVRPNEIILTSITGYRLICPCTWSQTRPPRSSKVVISVPSWSRLSKEVSNWLSSGYPLPLTSHLGVTIVQYRDKINDTAVQVETARRLHKVTQAYNVPLLINDRVDIAAAVGAEGVHLGQDDMCMLSNGMIEPSNTKLTHG